MERCIDCIHYKACDTWVKIWLGVETEFPYEAESNLCEHFEIPKHGEWTHTGYGGEWECSNCKSQIALSDDIAGHPRYCPSCGYNMIKEN